jgi:hypothetical protein
LNDKRALPSGEHDHARTVRELNARVSFIFAGSMTET